MTDLFLSSFETGGADQFQRVRSLRFSDASSALKECERSESELVLLSSQEMDFPTEPKLPGDLENCDLLHCGLKLGAYGFVQLPLYGCLSWHFLDPDISRASCSWKATPSFCWLRPATLRALGGFDRIYSSPEMQLMDFGFRLMLAGGRTRYDPSLVPGRIANTPVVSLPLVDEFAFMLRHCGTRVAAYAALSHGIVNRCPIQAWRAFKTACVLVREHPAPRSDGTIADKLRLRRPHTKPNVSGYSAIIPTLDRYDYLPKAIDSLFRQEPSPAEIIVVDQTPVQRRKPELYASYGRSNLRVIYLDKPGQAAARNAGICAVKSQWCLLFDDDSEAWPDMVAEHIRLVAETGASVSTGASLAPTKTRENIPIMYRNPFISDVLDTGNCFVKRDVLLAVGGLDGAFDHGPGVDNDLGTRLWRKGYEILFNPLAIRTHYKAPKGGLRSHGNWWCDRSGTWAPFPPPTTIYTIRRHLPLHFHKPQYVLRFLRAKARYKAGVLA